MRFRPMKRTGYATADESRAPNYLRDKFAKIRAELKAKPVVTNVKVLKVKKS